jgi:hypothetical protein
VREQTWLIGAKPARRPAIDVHTNAFVSGFAIDLPRAGFRAGDEPTISVVAGHALRLSLLSATTNGVIFVDGKRIGAIPAGSSRTLSLPVGRHTVKVIKG